MIGFLKKDLYMLSRMYRKNLLLVFAIYTVMVLVMHTTFLLYMLIWLMGFYGLSALTLDDSSGWDRYARTLPATAGQIITARFLVELMMIAAGVVLALVVGTLEALSQKRELGELFFAVPIITSLALLSMGLILPAAYRWGVDKARNTFLVLFIALFFLPQLLRKYGIPIESDMLRRLVRWLEESPRWLPPLVCLAIGALIFLLGGCLSTRIYRKKEF